MTDGRHSARDRGRRQARLTGPGRVVAAVGAAAVAVGWFVGLPDVAILGLLATALVGVAWAITAIQGIPATATRRVRPRRVQQGQTVQLHLDVRPTGRRATPTLAANDVVDGTDLPTQHLAPIPSGSGRAVVTSVVAAHRGIARIGPVTLGVTDPFGLARARRVVMARDEVIVWPRLVALTRSTPATGADDESLPATTAVRAAIVDDAPRLREFAAGDDVRRVHWPSTARVGAPVVREVDQAADHRTVVVLDVRRAHHDGASFERAVGAAASVVADRAGHGEPVTLFTTSGWSSGDVSDDQALTALLDHLAALQPQGGGSLRGVLRALVPAPGAGGRLVACVGRTLAPPDRTALAHATPGTDAVVVSCGDEPIAGPGVVEVRFGPTDDLGARWRERMDADQRHAGTARRGGRDAS